MQRPVLVPRNAVEHRDQRQEHPRDTHGPHQISVQTGFERHLVLLPFESQVCRRHPAAERARNEADDRLHGKLGKARRPADAQKP